MTVPNISPTAASTDPLPSFPHTLKVGELTIGEWSYTVSIESSDPLIATPNSDTIEKIKYLVDLHLAHLKSQGVDLSKIVIQQIDEEGLSYVNEDFEQQSLQSSELNFVPFDPSDENSSYPVSLQNQSISSISDIYRLIIDSLIKKTEGQEQETNTTKSPRRGIVFTPESEDSSIESADDKLEDDTIGLISGKEKISNEFKPNGIIANIQNFASNIWNALPTFNQKVDNNREPIINTQKIIHEEQSAFRSSLSESQKKDFDTFTKLNFK